ncbi:MAG TPA: LacI family DNA-binding transcriptional regulator [Candidatus Didemnitutus sp.]|jgi:DNA-binding LacI/PurR family transcriptional regulator
MNTKKLRVSYQDIANRLGFNKSTVSLALRGNPRIPEETRKRVRAIAKELGYRPDPTLSLLARYRWARQQESTGEVTLAYVVNRQRPFYSVQRPYLGGAQARARERGYKLVEFDLDQYSSGRAASKVLYHRGIRGLILSCIPPDELAPVVTLDWDRFTLVSLSHGWGHLPVHAVGNNYFASTRMVWHEVARRGYGRIGGAIMQENPPSIVDALRLGASLVAQRELSTLRGLVPLPIDFSTNPAQFLGWVEHFKPDVIVGRDRILYEWLLRGGYRVPEDVAFANLIADPSGPLAGVSVMVDKIGAAAVDHLIAQMHDNSWGVPQIRQTLELEPEWIDGLTLPDRRCKEAGASAASAPGVMRSAIR